MICEVGPRDGLQNAKHLMPTAAKKNWIRALADAGLKEIEVGSFVPPKLIPAMADTGEVVAFARTIPGLKVVALAPNLKGFQRALEAGAHKVTFPVSASSCAAYPAPGAQRRSGAITSVRCWFGFSAWIISVSARYRCSASGAFAGSRAPIPTTVDRPLSVSRASRLLSRPRTVVCAPGV